MKLLVTFCLLVSLSLCLIADARGGTRTFRGNAPSEGLKAGSTCATPQYQPLPSGVSLKLYFEVRNGGATGTMAWRDSLSAIPGAAFTVTTTDLALGTYHIRNYNRLGSYIGCDTSFVFVVVPDSCPPAPARGLRVE
jgi:hypothetical protein